MRDTQGKLIDVLAAVAHDPYKFVLLAFPWGEAGTDLADRQGPESWQIELLCSIRDGLLTPDQAIRRAVASGHGVGKSALVAWIILWAVATFPDARGVVTANTETQLKTKTWAELAKWYRLCIAKTMFTLTATALYSNDPERERTWRIDMVPWSERNTEAFAGLHNQGRRILVVFDEASAIPDAIHETTEGALTDADTEIVWLMCGNPTKNTGRFRAAFDGPMAPLWKTFRVDSRQVSFTNKRQIAEWIEGYGDDSDFVRVRVKGEFPRAGTMQFISTELVQEARIRQAEGHSFDAFVLGVDVARYGEDSSCIFFRKGRDARSIPPITLNQVDTMALASRVAEEYLRYRADAVFVDGGGVGGGVVDRLRQLRVPVFDVQFGAKPDRIGHETDRERYANKRAEMWGSLRQALKTLAIPDDDALQAELIGPEYALNTRDEIQLERKEDMKRRGVKSPDMADALALTYAYPVIPNSVAGGRDHGDRPQMEYEYDPLENLELT